MRLHERGLVYRGSYLVNWSPSMQTAVSDLEVCPSPGTPSVICRAGPLFGVCTTALENQATAQWCFFAIPLVIHSGFLPSHW